VELKKYEQLQPQTSRRATTCASSTNAFCFICTVFALTRLLPPEHSPRADNGDPESLAQRRLLFESAHQTTHYVQKTV